MCVSMDTVERGDTAERKWCYEYLEVNDQRRKGNWRRLNKYR